MNSWVLPHNLLDQMITHRSGDTLYFLFDRELAKSENSVVLLLRSITAGAKAMGVRAKLELQADEIIGFNQRTNCAKILLKYSYKNRLGKVELFERD